MSNLLCNTKRNTFKKLDSSILKTCLCGAVKTLLTENCILYLILSQKFIYSNKDYQNFYILLNTAFNNQSFNSSKVLTSVATPNRSLLNIFTFISMIYFLPSLIFKLIITGAGTFFRDLLQYTVTLTHNIHIFVFVQNNLPVQKADVNSPLKTR